MSVSDDALKNIMASFAAFDSNGNMSLDLAELTSVLRQIADDDEDEETIKQEAKDLMNAIDKDGNGEISYMEFFTAQKSKKLAGADEKTIKVLQKLASFFKLQKKDRDKVVADHKAKATQHDKQAKEEEEKKKKEQEDSEKQRLAAEEADREKARLEAERAALVASHQELSGKQEHELAQLRAANEKLHHDLSHAHTELHAKQAELAAKSELDAHIAKLHAQQHENESHIHKLKEENHELRSEKEAWHREKHGLTEEVNRLRGDSAGEIDVLQKRLQEKDAQLRELERQAELNRQSSLQQQQNAASDGDLALRQLTEKNAALAQQVEALLQEKLKLEQEKSRLEQEKAKLEQDKSKLEQERAHFQETDTYKKDNETLRQKLEEIAVALDVSPKGASSSASAGGSLPSSPDITKSDKPFDLMEEIFANLQDTRERLFGFMVVAIKYDAFLAGYNINFDAAEIYDEIQNTRLPRAKWPDQIRKRATLPEKAKPEEGRSSSPVVQVLVSMSTKACSSMP